MERNNFANVHQTKNVNDGDASSNCRVATLFAARISVPFRLDLIVFILNLKKMFLLQEYNFFYIYKCEGEFC